MKIQSKASLAFKKNSPAEKVSFGNNVIECLTELIPPAAGKPDFSNLPISIAGLTTLNNNLDAAITAARSGNHEDEADLDIIIAQWNDSFGITANFVSSVALGNIPAIISTGYLPTKNESTSVQEPGVMKGFTVSPNAKKGVINAGTKIPMPGAKAFVFAAVPAGVEVSYINNTLVLTVGGQSMYIATATKKQASITNMPSAITYFVTGYAINGAGSGAPTAIQEVVPQ